MVMDSVAGLANHCWCCFAGTPGTWWGFTIAQDDGRRGSNRLRTSQAMAGISATILSLSSVPPLPPQAPVCSVCHRLWVVFGIGRNGDCSFVFGGFSVSLG